MLQCVLYKLITIRWRRTVLIPLLTFPQAASLASDPPTRRLQGVCSYKMRQSGQPEHFKELLTEYVPTRNIRSAER